MPVDGMEEGKMWVCWVFDGHHHISKAHAHFPVVLVQKFNLPSLQCDQLRGYPCRLTGMQFIDFAAALCIEDGIDFRNQAHANVEWERVTNTCVAFVKCRQSGFGRRDIHFVNINV